ncbi:MAG: hypothetical protein RBQ91_01030 [Acholeplasma sp.]|nr:hypothetical protein [Acholeplasma sp.]
MNKSQINTTKENKIMTWMVRWYEYNKYKIPVIFTLLGTLLFTLFLDFRTGGFTFRSHIASIQMVTSKIIGFYLFAIYLIAMIQLFNSMSFSKKRSPVSFFLFLILNTIQGLLVFSYVKTFFEEAVSRADYTIPSYTHMSIWIMIIGMVFYVVATVFAAVYVNWKYVKIEE